MLFMGFLCLFTAWH